MPPGAGKSTSLYIPTITYNARVNLHTQDAQGIGQGASMVLVSVKDDLYTITSAELKKCGYRVLKLDLRNVFCSCHFNLLYRVNIEIDAWRKAFPSFSHMATVLHMAIGTVQTAIKSLVAAGRLLKAAFRAGKHNLYILVETVARALPGANPGAQKENRRAGTRRQVRDIAEKTIAHILYKLNILQLIGVCQGILSFTVSRVCQNLRNSNKTNPTYSTKERYFSLSKLAIGGEARLLEPDAGINGKAPLAQTEGFRMPPRFRTHSLPDCCARLFFSLYSRCHRRRQQV